MRRDTLGASIAELPWADWVRLHRPLQWTKNLVVLSALVFGGQADSASHVVMALTAVLSFMLVSSAGYIWNDWWDRERDRVHPEKRHRPIASGRVEPGAALLWGTSLLVAALALSLLVSPALLAIIAIYALLMGAYTTHLKHVPVLDVVVIAVGFVLRAVAGAVAVDVAMSRWLLVCTLLLSLFLGYGKRRHEFISLGQRAALHRPALGLYSVRLLNGLILTTASLTLLAYTAYAATTATVTTHWPMVVTVPIVVFAVGRYLILIFRHNSGGSPEAILVRDRPLILAIGSWAVAIIAVLARFQA